VKTPTPETAGRLPLGVRLRLGREVAADLEGAYEELRARGLTAEQAWARARALVLPDAAAWTRLARVHRPLHAVLADRFSARAVERTERLAVIGVAGATILLMAGPLLALGPGSAPAPTLVPVFAAGAILAAVLASAAYRLLARSDADPDAMQAHLRATFALVAITVLVGGMGALADTWVFAARASAQPVTLPETMAWLGGTAHLLATALGLALGGALGWYVLLHAATRALGDLARDPWSASPPSTHPDPTLSLEMTS
jgi:hypothetical protein